MIEAVKIWNEPNNKSHWDPELDPGFERFAEMARLAGAAIREVRPGLTRVMGGISPIDPKFVQLLDWRGGLSEVDAVGVHGFPLDWNPWRLDEWGAKLDEIGAVTALPVWVTEVGVSTFGADWVQAEGLRRTAEILLAREDVPRVFWYSLFDLPHEWEATTRHREAEGSSYYRHFHLGLVREDGTPKEAYEAFRPYAPELGVCQWFHFEDHRLDDAVARLRDLGVTRLRTGLSWGDRHREGALDWFDRQMEALEGFDTTVTFCFTPPSRGIAPHYASPPLVPEEFAWFCAEMVERYVPALSGSGRVAL